MSRRKTKTVRVKRITNRLLESTAKLDRYSREGITAINSDAPSQVGLWIRPGAISPKTGKLGAHSIYCRFKTQNPRPHVIKKLAEIYTREADYLSGQVSLAEVETICARWREQGFKDQAATVIVHEPENDNGDAVNALPTFDECFEHRINADAHGVAFEKSETYVKEARRKWRTLMPDTWKLQPVDSIRSPHVTRHADKIRLREWKSQNPVNMGATVGGRWGAYEWLAMMSIMFTKSRKLHELPINPFEIVLADTVKPKANGYRCLTEQEIKAVLNVTYEQVGDPHSWLRMLALRVGLLTGMRRGGLVGLKVAEINGTAIERDVADKDRFRRGHKLSIPTQLRETLDETLALKNGEHRACQVRLEDAPHADEKRNAPSNDRELKAGGGVLAKR